MRFAFTDEQIEFRDGLRALLEKECTPAHLRDAWTNATGRVPGLWDQLVDMGVVALLAPEADGGLGLTFEDLVLLLEETGRHADVIEVKGSVELAPLIGLADGIVDLVATGRTLKENGLEIREEIATSTARLISNRVSHKLRAVEVDDLVERLRPEAGR